MTVGSRTAVVGAVALTLALLVTSCGGGSTHKPVPAANAAPAGGQLRGEGEDAAIWIAKNVGGSIVKAAGTEAFNEVLKALGLNTTNPQLDAIQAQLTQIQAQLTELQKTVDEILRQLTAEQFNTLVQPVNDLASFIFDAENNLSEALNLAKQNPRPYIDILRHIGRVKDDVDKNGIRAKFDQPGHTKEAVISYAILHTGPTEPLYEVLSHVVIGRNPSPNHFFTWRQSAAIDNYFQKLLYLQALQFNLIVQVATLENDSPDFIWRTFGAPYLGDQATFKAYAEGKGPMPKSGVLFDELRTELKLVPKGAVVQPASRLEWSADIPSGAKEFGVSPSGPGYPVCKAADPRSRRVTCLNNLPDDVIGYPDRGPLPTSAVPQLRANLAKAGYGPAKDWDLPSMDQMQGLLSGWDSSQGPPKAWLEKEARSDPATCTPVQAGTGQAVSDDKACIWPSPLYWTNSYSYFPVNQHVDWYPPQQAVQSDIVIFDYGWRFDFFDVSNNGRPSCELGPNKLDWSELADNLHALDDQFQPEGVSMDLHPSPSCGGSMALVRKIPAGEQYFFPL